MPLESDRCICLRKVEYSETSQILTLFGRRFGILKLIAKGAHRRTKAGASRFDGGVDLLDLGDAVFSHSTDRNLPPLTEWSLVDGHLGLRSNLRAVNLALYSAELVSAVMEEHDPHPAIFDRLARLLQDLCGAQVEESFLAFLLELLRESGYLPELGNCVECSRMPDSRERSYFSAAKGGFVCRNCEMHFPDRTDIDTRLLMLAQSVLKLPQENGTTARLPRLSRVQTDPLNKLLAAHIEHTLGKPLRVSAYALARKRGGRS